MPRLLLGLILVAGFALRIWNNDYGLPYVWSIDEGSHFANHAIEMFWQDLDPGYYENPSAYTYLLYALLRVMYGPLGWLFDLPFGNVTEQFSKDPTQIWVAARTLAAVLCMVGVAAMYWAARRLWGTREGLVAAAVLAFAFLPVAYSRVAVTDVGALAGMALAVYGSVRAYEDGRWAHYALAGAGGRPGGRVQVHRGPGAAAAGLAALARVRRDRLRALGGLVLGTALAALVFLVLNPYLPGSFDAWWNDLHDQADVASGQPKPGQEEGGAGYYLDSLTWGLGWAAALAALAGAALELRRDLIRGLILVAVPVALFVYLSLQARYFGRWLLPAYPALAMLAAVALVRAADALPARRGRFPLRAVALPALVALVLAQPAGGGRAQRAGARPRGHPHAGARLARGALPAGAARGDRAGGARPLLPLEPVRHACPAGSPAARRARDGRRRGSPTPGRAGGGSASASSRASSPGRTAACGPRRTTWCSRPR